MCLGAVRIMCVSIGAESVPLNTSCGGKMEVVDVFDILMLVRELDVLSG
jgi:hypothetical protein